MKIAYVTTYDSSYPGNWSGTGYYIRKALEKQDVSLNPIGPLERRIGLWNRVKEKCARYLLGKVHMHNREPSVQEGYGRQVEERLRSDVDVIFSPGTIPVSSVAVDIPVVFWTDATFSGITSLYPAYKNLDQSTIENGHAMEQRALNRCSLALYSSEWAARTARQEYDVEPSKVKVVPFGANLEVSCPRGHDDIDQFLRRRRGERCRLLFVGKDWERKGGDTALKVARILNQRGTSTELVVVGCEPELTVEEEEYVSCMGVIDKSNASGRKRLRELFVSSDFLLLPTRAECFGIVFAEASAHGLPSLATDVGGVPTALRDERNGFTLPVEADPEAYADLVETYWRSPEDYERLSHSAFDEYWNRLNWETAATEVTTLLRSL